MNALVVGSARSMWVKEFIKNVLLPEGLDITVLNDPMGKSNFSEYYEKNGIKYAGQYRPSPLLSKIPKLRGIYKRRKTLKSLSDEKKRYDLIFIVSTEPFNVKCAKATYQKGTRVFALFIGSDILRINRKNAEELMSQLHEMDAQPITFGKNTEIVCRKYLTDGMKQPLAIDFGSSQFDGIDMYLDKGRAFCKSAFGLEPDTFTVCIGNNGSPAQEHLKIIEAINTLPDDANNKISLIIPMTYGGKTKYKEKVKEAASKHKCAVLEDFMDSDEVSKLRVASDIYINAQVTDALSKSMLEHIYAGSAVIIGSWLTYPELDEWGIRTQSFNDYTDLPRVILECISDSNINNERVKNRKIIHDYTSWDTCRAKWHNVLFE